MIMKRISCILGTLILCFGVGQGLAAQELDDAQKAAAEAAKVMSEAPEVKQKVEKPKYWNTSLKTNVSFGQTSLTNWAAGGDNTVSLAAFIDANANYKKNDMFLLQLRLFCRCCILCVSDSHCCNLSIAIYDSQVIWSVIFWSIIFRS